MVREGRPTGRKQRFAEAEEPKVTHTIPRRARRKKFLTARQLVRPSLSSSDPPDRLWQGSLGEFAVLTPTVQFPIAPRRLQRRQRQDSRRRPTHPTVLAT